MLEKISTMAGCFLCKIGWHKLDNLLDRDGSFGVDVSREYCVRPGCPHKDLPEPYNQGDLVTRGTRRVRRRRSR